MDKYTYIICGKFYNGIEPEFKENYKILVKNEKIEAVGTDIPKPESAQVIDLSDATVTPGMIDAHMHMDYIDWHTVREEVYTRSQNYCLYPYGTENTVQRVHNHPPYRRHHFQRFRYP